MHRDIKPENLLLKSKLNDYEIILVDFGLASFINSPEILYKRCGTPGFIAPEVLTFQVNLLITNELILIIALYTNFKQDGTSFYNDKCDVFSAGIIFYILLTGKKPFNGNDYKQILK